MFHVSTLLPYTANDGQQVQKKRHIGNDIVALVFQDRKTPFTPEMIASHFLHSFVIVAPVNDGLGGMKYEVFDHSENSINKSCIQHNGIGGRLC